MQTLLIPDFQTDVGPESFYLASLANLKICDYTEVSAVLKEFRKRFRVKASELLKLKENPESPAVQKLVSLLQEKRVSMQELSGQGNKLPRHSTRDENLYFLVQRHTRMAEEAKKAKILYSQSLTEGTALVGFQAKMENFRKSIEGRARNSYTAILNRVRELANFEINEIATILNNMQIVEAEFIQQLAMSERVITDTSQMKQKEKLGTTGSKERYSLTFPFQGEIWFDELNNYKIDVAKGCQSGKGKTL